MQSTSEQRWSDRTRCRSLFIDRYLYKSRGGETLPPSNLEAMMSRGRSYGDTDTYGAIGEVSILKLLE